ncbi:ubiE/COQ5 methyltransferase, putative [Plasmodium reichenowi]|uniref:2-methoxy-6-polyprenyl-1,4-benzoquinol methylase, mitochondrial n=1 Tax=Plasmodium reichenowi TaxID=5854 RepID=A0A2P9D4L3_PLARE|nr:ubiE/COQ5 methyltransferase, putative [Plasmodium reichenowi]
MKITKIINYNNIKMTHVWGGIISKASHFSTQHGQYDKSERICNFGFQKVSEEIKSRLVYNLFSNVCNKYDIMNDVMSLLIHRFWKDQFVKELDVLLKYHSYNIQDYVYQHYKDYSSNNEKIQKKNENISDTNVYSNNYSVYSDIPNYKILDLAGGTGDIAFRILEKSKFYLKKNNQSIPFDHISYQQFLPHIIVCDVNNDMLNVGKKKATTLGYDQNLTWLVQNAENLESIESNSIDVITLSFGIRNFTNIPQALKEIHRVLKPGGRFLCLEFCKVQCHILNIFYKFYLNNVIPIIGKVVANDMKAYKYLAQSIQTFLTPDELAQLFHQANFKNITYTTMTMGIVSIHSAYKLV